MGGVKNDDLGNKPDGLWSADTAGLACLSRLYAARPSVRQSRGGGRWPPAVLPEPASVRLIAQVEQCRALQFSLTYRDMGCRGIGETCARLSILDPRYLTITFRNLPSAVIATRATPFGTLALELAMSSPFSFFCSLSGVKNGPNAPIEREMGTPIENCTILA